MPPMSIATRTIMTVPIVKKLVSSEFYAVA